MIFHEIQFPKVISSGARGGPRRADEMTVLASGFREVNSPWADSLREYDAGVALRNADDLDLVIHFWEGRRGRLHPFRWWDPADFKSCAPLSTPSATDQSIGTGDDATTVFPLQKTYEPAGPNPYARRIHKPVAGTVLVAVAGTPLTEGVGFTLDAALGEVTLAAAPTAGQAVTAGFEFDTPARFALPSIDTAVRDFANGSIPEIPVTEERLPQ